MDAALHRSFTAGVAEAQVQRRDDDHVQRRRGDQTAQDDDGHRRLDLAAGLTAGQRQRHQRERGGQRGHQDWHKPLPGPCANRFGRVHAVFVDKPPDMIDEDHAVSGCNAEQRDEADQRGDGHHAPGQPDAGHAAYQRQRQVQHHQRRVAGRIEGRDQQEEDADDDHAAKQDQASPGGLGALELAAELDVITGWKIDLPIDLPPHVLDHADQVAVGDIGHHDQLALNAFTADRVGSAGSTDIGDRIERHLGAGGGFEHRVAQGLQIVTHIFRITHDQIETGRSFEHAADHRAAERRLDHLGSRGHRYAVARQRRAIKLQRDERYFALLFHGHVDGAWDFGHDLFDAAAQLPQFGQFRAEDLDRDIGACAGQHVIDAMRYRLADDDVGAGNRGELPAQSGQERGFFALAHLEVYVDFG